MRLTLAQIGAGTDKKRNLEVVAGLARAAGAAGADLIAFPEYTMYDKKAVDSTFAAEAEPLDGQFVDGLRALAVQLNLTIVAGVVESNSDDRRPYNTLFAVGPTGAILARYRKVHLFDSFGFRESEFIRPSDSLEPVTFAAGDFTVGLMTCYDLRFPEQARAIADAGAQLMLACSSWVPGTGKVDQWKILAQARAIENSSYFGAVSQTPPISIGHSLLVDAMGRVIGEFGETADAKLFDIDLDSVHDARKLNPALDQRRYPRFTGDPVGRSAQ